MVGARTSVLIERKRERNRLINEETGANRCVRSPPLIGCAVVHILRHGYAAFILFPDQNPDTEVIFTEHLKHFTQQLQE